MPSNVVLAVLSQTSYRNRHFLFGIEHVLPISVLHLALVTAGLWNVLHIILVFPYVSAQDVASLERKSVTGLLT